MASQKCVLIGLLIFFVAFIIIGVILLVAISVFSTSDQKQIITYYSTSEKSTIATLKSPFQVTSTFDNMKSSTTSLTTQANLNATSVELLTKSDISTIKPNDTKGTIEPTLYNGTSITTTIWDTQSTDITTSAIFLIKQNTTKNPISTTISSKGIETGILHTTLLGCQSE